MSAAAPLPDPAERFDPPVRRVAWEVERDLPFDALLATGAARTGLTPATFERLVWHGGLHAGGRRVDPATSPTHLAAGTPVVAYAFTREPEPIELGAADVLHDDDHLVVLRKPSWLPTQPTRASIRFCLEAEARRLLGSDDLRTINRLDRGTSGAVLFARTAAAARYLWRQFFERRVRKGYLAAVSPTPREERFTVRGDLVQVHHPRHAYFELRPSGTPGGRASETAFEIGEIRGPRALLRAAPVTGRTHQIRIHCAAAGCPILGDRLYGGGSADRLLLHAHTLGFAHPLRGRPVDVTAPIPADFQW